jgi:glutamate--cysteine ligase
MPRASRALSSDDVLSYVRDVVFLPTTRTDVGLEVEWIPIALASPDAAVDLEILRALVDPATRLPNGGQITFEPGGQLEISSQPASVGAVNQAITWDLDWVRERLVNHGIALVAAGMDPNRRGPRLLHLPRYDAMEHYFDSGWPNGRSMMRSSAAVQINLDVGAEDQADRWWAAHAIGPTLAACFANSAIASGRPTGWRSTRLAVWESLDPSRTQPAYVTGDPVSDWTVYSLAARVMFIAGDQGYRTVEAPLTFRQWLERGHELGYPTAEDLALHMTTLFPPVRPKGWLELRMVDALPEPWWRVPSAIAAALVYGASHLDRSVLAPAEGLWTAAAQRGLSHPALAASARHCFEVAMELMREMDVDPETRVVTEVFNERYVTLGRCPADDQLQDWAKKGPANGARSLIRSGIGSGARPGAGAFGGPSGGPPPHGGHPPTDIGRALIHN